MRAPGAQALMDAGFRWSSTDTHVVLSASSRPARQGIGTGARPPAHPQQERIPLTPTADEPERIRLFSRRDHAGSGGEGEGVNIIGRQVRQASKTKRIARQRGRATPTGSDHVSRGPARRRKTADALMIHGL
jgi:hypothetical protein